MPKKKSPSVKDKKRKHIVKEIKSGKKIIESKKESNLEEGVSELEEKHEFIPSFSSIESSAPVLRKVETPTALETNIISQSISAEAEENESRRQINYAGNAPNYGFSRDGNEPQEEAKYESEFRAPILETRRFAENRREFTMPRNEQFLRTSDGDREKFETRTIENQNRLPFEQEEKKYKKVKL